MGKVMTTPRFHHAMTSSCPNCGSSLELEEHDVRLRTGTCGSCTKEFVFVEGTSVASKLGSPGSRVTGGEDARPEGPAEGPQCATCGAPLTFQVRGHGSLEVTCEDCGTAEIYVAAKRPPSFDRGRPDRSGAGPPRGRPCRQCGAPLRFSNDDDGNLVGECAACGNRFTLPPRDRPEGRAPGGRGEGRYGRRDFGGPNRGPRSGGGYRGKWSGSSDRRRAGSRPRPDDDEPRRVRRRRSDQ